MLESRGLKVYGSPRPDRGQSPLHAKWNYLKQAIGYLLWQIGVKV